MIHSLLPLLALACAPTSNDTSAVDAGEGSSTVPPMLPVAYSGTTESVVIQVVRPLPSGADQMVGFAEVVDGQAVVRLRDRPPFALMPRVAYRIAARSLDADGVVGQYLGVSDDVVLYVRDGSVAEGWYLLHDGTTELVPLRIGTEVVDTLSFVGSMLVSGAVGEDVAEYRAALAMVTDGDVASPMYTNDMMNIDGDTFSLIVAGPPPEETLMTEEGPTSGHFWPAAWTDNDGRMGFDPVGDAIVGFACSGAGPASLVWSTPPTKLRDALHMVEEDLRAGWTLHVEVEGGGQPGGGEILTLSSTCM